MVKTPSVPFTEQVMSQVVVVTSKKKMRSNTLPFMFIPSGSSSVGLNKKITKELSCFMIEENRMLSSSLTTCNSPQSTTSHSHSSSSDLTDVSMLLPSPPANNDLSSILDICVQSLDVEAEEKILLTAILPANSLPVKGNVQWFDLDHAV